LICKTQEYQKSASLIRQAYHTIYSRVPPACSRHLDHVTKKKKISVRCKGIHLRLRGFVPTRVVVRPN